MAGFKRSLQHRFNPLHVYCRLRDMGVGVARAHKVCEMYERFFYRFVIA